MSFPPPATSHRLFTLGRGVFIHSENNKLRPCSSVSRSHMNRPIVTTLVTLLTVSSLTFAETLEINSPLPAVSAPDQENTTLTLDSLSSEKWVLVFFYPKAHTPGCTKQACSLRDAYKELSEAGVKVIGVSNDKVKAQKSFTEKHKLPFTLLADSEAKVIKAFGVPQTPGVGFARRQAYLFKEGKLIWKDEKASTKKQAEDVLAQIKNS